MTVDDESSVNETIGIPVVDLNTSGSATASQSKKLSQQPLQPFVANALQSLSGGAQMFPVDQNSVLMTNAAAAIAAVAASAMNSMNQGNTVGGTAGVGVSPVLLAALRNSGLVPPTNSAPSQVASLLSAVSNGGGSLAGLSIPVPTGSLPSNLHGQLQQLLNQVETNKLSTSPPAPPVSHVHSSSSLSIGPSIGSTPIGGMQGWGLKQLGKFPLSTEPQVAIPRDFTLIIPQPISIRTTRCSVATTPATSSSNSSLVAC
jgi:hypothetical protein